VLFITHDPTPIGGKTWVLPLFSAGIYKGAVEPWPSSTVSYCPLDPPARRIPCVWIVRRSFSVVRQLSTVMHYII